MYSRKKNRWLKHLDFMLLDIVSIVLSLFLSYGFRHGFASRYAWDEYQRICGVMIVIDIVMVFFRNSYKDVIRRGYLKELRAAFTHFTLVMTGLLLYLFVMKQTLLFSRLTLFGTWGIGCFLMYAARVSLKTWIRRRMQQKEKLVSVLLIVSTKVADETVRTLSDRKYRDYEITGIIVVDRKRKRAERINGVPVVADVDGFSEYIKEHVVDEIFINVSDGFQNAERIAEAAIGMGITVHQNLMGITQGNGNKVIDEFAGYTVMTSSLKVAAYSELFFKRCMDIIGGFVGIVMTLVMFPFIAVAIRRKDRGPVLFSQERVGKNGRRFRIYKFRSMYTDAEKRKKELMARNEMQGQMFKIREDPRVIPGIGEFIRKTSLDEFPQFWNVLKGDMSLVGTHPPTVEEYEQYDMHHLVRMSIKPGLTGLWQVSGRNEITDFEEVVKLDTRYIENWSLNMDVKILMKTVQVVLRGEGE